MRFLTNPDVPGTEKLAISSFRTEKGVKPPFPLKAEQVGYPANSLAPQSAFMVKGWSRSMAAWTILLAAYEDKEFAEVGPKH